MILAISILIINITIKFIVSELHVDKEQVNGGSCSVDSIGTEVKFVH